FAESLGAAAAQPVYLATARPDDSETAKRIARHQLDRPAHWTTVEAPLEIAHAVEANRDRDFILLDCLTLWLSNLCFEHRAESEACIERAAGAELARIAAVKSAAHIAIVTNEVGCGIVPDSPVARFFRDLQGRMNQHAAALATQVFHVVAGIPVR